VIVRPATHDDIPRIVEMARDFYATTAYPDLFGPMANESAAGLAILTMQSGVMLVAETDGAVVGMVCLHVEPFLFNPDAGRIASELVWWIEPEHRGGTLAGRMLKAVNDACTALDAVPRMATLASSPPQAQALLERYDYRETERYFTRGH
jgi:L-amino acid N-acyltransferase YncA